MERDGEPGADLAPLAVAQRDEEPQGRHRVGLRVERLSGGGMLRVAALVRVACLLLLQLPGVGQQQVREVARRGCAVDGAAEAVAREERQRAGVVDMSVGEDDGVDRRGRHREGLPVPQPELLRALEETGVHQDRPARGANQVAGAGDRACRAEEADGRHRGSNSRMTSSAPPALWHGATRER